MQRNPVFGYWDGYKANDTKVEEKIPSFQVRKNCNMLKRSIDYVVSVGCDREDSSCYRIQRSSGKSGFIITDRDGILVAKVITSLLYLIIGKEMWYGLINSAYITE